MDLEKMMEEVKKEYGKPLFITGKNSVNLNQQFFVAYFAKKHKPVYYVPEKNFYMYNKDTGVWQIVSEERMLGKLGKALGNFSKLINEKRIQRYRTASTLSALLKLLKGEVEKTDAFQNYEIKFVHCSNCVLEYNEVKKAWQKKDFSPHYYSRNQNPINYSPKSKCSRFTSDLLGKAMSQDDIDHLQMYLGQCIIGRNLSQTFLMLTGTAGGGKSTLANIIEGIVGRWNCTELRLEHMNSRFEISRASGKNLLTAKDVTSSFMNDAKAGKLKALTGNDTMTIERKNSNSILDVQGNFNVIITSNASLQIKLDGDLGAWRRRMLLIRYEKPATNEVIVDFDQKLLKEEGSGILNWALEGAVKLLKAGGKIEKSKKQQAVVNRLLKSSRPFEVFAELYIHPTLDVNITTEEAVTAFTKFCSDLKWPLLSECKIQRAFHEWMRSKHVAVLRTDIKRNGTNRRGYAGFQISDK
jgi:P4 family phage/plasmid primase-like protien